MAGRSAHPSVESAGEVTGSGARWPLSARVEGFARDAARVERAIAGRVMKQHRLGIAMGGRHLRGRLRGAVVHRPLIDRSRA